MRAYWVESDLNICSNLFKLYAIFQYHENSLEDYLSDHHNKAVSDCEVIDFVRQMMTALTYLERNQMVYLLAGPKSIMVAEDDDNSLQELSNENDYTDRYSYNKLSREVNDRQKCSLAELNRKYFANDSLINLKPDSQQKHKSLNKKKVYKLFQPF